MTAKGSYETIDVIAYPDVDVMWEQDCVALRLSLDLGESQTWLTADESKALRKALKRAEKLAKQAENA